MVLSSVEGGVGPKGIFTQLRALATIVHTKKMGTYFSLVEKSLKSVSDSMKPKTIQIFSPFRDPRGYFGRLVSSF